ncbi:MAG: hypothetical protein Q8S73_38395 [Deltaproteobacteria bacterium]|nr:hypothetical protein [Myxococcales bacterium]MDP3220034.1 hypothetical protein [Deltaproteobacteria bacterium]
MTDDPLARLRAAALHGLTPLAPVAFSRRPKARRGVTHPEIPVGAAAPAREPMPAVLLHEAAAWWRRCAPGWAPPLEALVERGVVAVHREGATLRVDARNAGYRVRGLPEAWMAVVVAALTGREMVPTRAALRSGVVTFRPGVSA